MLPGFRRGDGEICTYFYTHGSSFTNFYFLVWAKTSACLVSMFNSFVERKKGTPRYSILIALAMCLFVLKTETGT